MSRMEQRLSELVDELVALSLGDEDPWDRRRTVLKIADDPEPAVDSLRAEGIPCTTDHVLAWCIAEVGPMAMAMNLAASQADILTAEHKAEIADLVKQAAGKGGAS